MPRSDSSPLFQQFSADAMAEELYPDFFEQSFSSITNLPPEAPLEDSIVDASLAKEDFVPQTDFSFFPQPQAEQFSFFPQPQAVSTERFLSTSQKRPVVQPKINSRALNISETQSLVAALQSTMSAKQSIRQPVVIPGQKRTRREQRQRAAAEHHISPRLRILIILGIVLGLLIISLAALSPLSAADNSMPLIKSLSGWTRAEQTGLSSIASHLMGNQFQAAATGQNTKAPAAPPIAVVSQSQYVSIAQQDAIAAGISPVYFTRQIMAESSFNPNAVSPSGAVGIAQFLPSTAAGLGFNPYDPIAALKGAATYMAHLSQQYNGDYAKALAAYNAGSGTVNNAVRLGGANWMNYLPAETRAYVAKIIGL